MKYDMMLFLIITFIGVFLRLYHLDYPLGLHGDEAWTGIEANRILATGPIGIWSPSALGQASLPFYWTAFVFKLLGSNLITLRLSFVLLQVITLPLFYFCIRYLFKEKVSLVAYFLFATSNIFVHFSHVTPTHALFMVGFLPTIFFFLRGFQKNEHITIITAGFFLGISQYLYVGLRLLPVFFILYFIATIFKQKNHLKEHLLHILLFFIPFLITVVPLGYYGFEHRSDFLSRTNGVSIFVSTNIQHEKSSNITSVLQSNAIKTALMFNVKGDGDAQDNNEHRPLLTLIPFLFFLLGLCISIFKIRDDRYFFLCLFFTIFLSGTIFSVDAPNFRRVQPSIAAMDVFISIGTIWLYDLLQSRLPKFKMFFLSMLVAGLLTLAYQNDIYYFTVQAVSAETKSMFSYDKVLIANFLQSLHQSVYVYYYDSGASFNYETYRFLLPNRQGEDRSKEFGTYSLLSTNSKQNVIYIFRPEYEFAFEAVKLLYPEGKESILYGEQNIVFYAYLVPKNIELQTN